MNLTKIEIVKKALEVNDAKEYYRVIGDDEDISISMTLDAAVIKAEQRTNLSLGIYRYEMSFDSFVQKITLLKPPLLEIESVLYLDKDDTYKELDYELFTCLAQPAFLLLQKPEDFKEAQRCIVVRYKAGYEDIPAPIKNWILIYGLTLFEQREGMVVGTSVSTEPSKYYDHLLDSYRIRPL